MTIKDALRLFKLKCDFTEEELKRAFNCLSLKTHPDRGGTLKASSDVNAANAILKKYFIKTAIIKSKYNISLGLDSNKHYSREEIRARELVLEINSAKLLIGLDITKEYSLQEIQDARFSDETQQFPNETQQYSDQKKAQQLLLKQLDLSPPLSPLLTVKNKVNALIYDKILVLNVIAAIMILKTEESLIAKYEPDSTDTTGNYEIHDLEEQKAFNKYYKKLEAIASEKLRNILFTLLNKKFMKNQNSLKNSIAGIILIKNVLKPWKKITRFLEKFDISKNYHRRVDWRNSSLAKITYFEY